MTQPSRPRHSQLTQSSHELDDPTVLIVHPLDGQSDRVTLTISSNQAKTFVELLRSRELGVEPRGVSGTGLSTLQAVVANDGRAVDDLEDCLEIILQLIGRAVFGPPGQLELLDVTTQGRNYIEVAVLRAFALLRPHLPHTLY